MCNAPTDTRRGSKYFIKLGLRHGLYGRARRHPETLLLCRVCSPVRPRVPSLSKREDDPPFGRSSDETMRKGRRGPAIFSRLTTILNMTATSTRLTRCKVH